MYMVTPIIILGIVIVGVNLERIWYYMVVAVGLGLFVFGIMIITIAINSYVLDSYLRLQGRSRGGSMLGGRLAGSLFRISKSLGRKTEGTQKSLGIQAAVVGAAFLIFIVPFHIFGSDLRVKQGKVKL